MPGGQAHTKNAEGREQVKGDAQKDRQQAQAANAGRRRRRRAGRRTLHYFLLLPFFLGIGLILCLTVFFKIEAINVIGSDKYDPLELARVSGVVEGDNLFRISAAAIEENLVGLTYPYIESIEVNRRIPATVEIVVTQSTPSGMVKEGEDYVLITRDGKVLERGLLFIPEDIPLILGLDTRDVQPGEYVGTFTKQPVAIGETEQQTTAREKADEENEAHAEEVKASLVMVEYLLRAMEESGFTSITNVDITDPLNMRIMYENRLLLELGSEADLTYKLELVKAIIQEKLEPDARGTLHADNVKAKKVVFTPEHDYEPPDDPSSAVEEEETDEEEPQ
jgi:cell division septal protein FtsQ